MRGYARVASVSLLMMGLLAAPNLSLATDRDGNGRHSLLNSELRSKIENLRDKMANHREHHHNVNQGNVAGDLAALQTEVANLQAALNEMAKNDAALVLQLNDARTRLANLENIPPSTGTTNPALTELAKYVKVDPGTINGLKGPHVIFHHANVHVESGSGQIPEYTVSLDGTVHAIPEALNGLGNLIVGYNDTTVPSGYVNPAAHNLVVGSSHKFTSLGGAVFGNNNVASGPYATVLGGRLNQSLGSATSMLGGFNLQVMQNNETYP